LITFRAPSRWDWRGLIVVDPRVPYNFIAKQNEHTRFYKRKPKTVTKQFIKLMKERKQEEWKDGGKETVSEYTVKVEEHDVTFVDMQQNREGHDVRIKWMEKCPGAPWPCRGERGYRHMHIASKYDINIPVDNSELTKEQVQKVRYLMGSDRVLFNPVGFKSDDWNRRFRRKQDPEEEPVPARAQKPIQGLYEDLTSLFDNEEPAGSAPVQTKPVQETVVIVLDEQEQAKSDSSKKQKTDHAPGAAGGAGQQKTPRQVPEWMKPPQPKAAAKGKSPRAGAGASAERRPPKADPAK
jgi:hypothetical protein